MPDATPSLKPAGVVRLPPRAPGMRIGILGGTFNPPHEAHRLVSRTAMRRLGLDRVWWLVTPGNPLKNNAGLPSLAARMAAARERAGHPHIVVTDVEAQMGLRYTRDTLAELVRRCPGVDFVWLMGADNLAGFHRWRNWRDIARIMPIAVIDRPGSTLRALRAPAAAWLAPYRLDETDAPLLAGGGTPAWVFVHGPRSALSSTALRQTGQGLRETVQRGADMPKWNAGANRGISGARARSAL